MNKPLIGLAALLLSSAIQTAYAAPADDACAALMEARSNLVGMIGSTDKSTYDGLKGNIQSASAKVDASLAAMQKSYNAGDEAKAKEFKTVWDAFKTTRDAEIIPALYAGRGADAKALATGVQAERMGKMKATMGCK